MAAAPPKLLQKGGGLAAVQITGRAMGLLRIAIYARLLTLEDMGVTSAILLSVALVDAFTNAGADRLCIQSSQGDDPGFQRGLQAFEVARGATATMLLLMAAPVLVLAFDMQYALTSFLVVALVPLLRGFVHFDTWRAQRSLDFRPYIVMELSAQLTATVVALIGCLVAPSYRVAVVVAILQMAMMVGTSHALSTRSYRLDWRWSALQPVIRFGLPLMLSGSCLFLIIQAEKLVVATLFTAALLALYSNAHVLTSTARTIVGQVYNSIFLPILARVEGDREQFAVEYSFCCRLFSVTALALAVFLVIAAEPLVLLVLGREYMAAVPVFRILAIGEFLWLLRIAPALGALSKADSVGLMQVNLFRLGLVVLPVLAALAGFGLVALATTFAIAELVTLVFASRWLSKRDGLEHNPLPSLLLSAPVLVLVYFTSLSMPPDSLVLVFSVALIASGATLTTGVFLSPQLRGRLPGRSLS